MTGINDPKIDDEMLFRANSDMAKRSGTGSFIYLLIWFALVVPNTFYETAPEICLWFTSLFLFFSATRLALIYNFEKLYRKNPQLWSSLFYPSVWLPALCWGLLCSMAMSYPVFVSISLVVIISTAGLAGGGVASIVPNRLLTIGFLSAILFPGIVTLIYSDAYNVSMSLVFCIYWIGMFSVTKIQHREYWRGLNASFLLQKHAKDLQQKNTIDGLTGLKNRSFFDEMLRKEFKTAIRSSLTLSLLLIDIDHFKKVNDHHGHLVGDECLRSFSNILKEQIKRETDIVARYGGEEFVVILPGMDREQTQVMAEKIRKEVESFVFSLNETRIMLTASIGISSINPQHGDSEQMIIEMADIALYKAKKNGRNRVV